MSSTRLDHQPTAPMAFPAEHAVTAVRLSPDGRTDATLRHVAAEVPLSITYNGLAYAVMMVTPDALEDFAMGFTLTQKIAARPADILDAEIITVEHGLLAKVEISAERFGAVTERRRSIVGQTGCGLCGIVELERALLPLDPITQPPEFRPGAIFRALEALAVRQPLHRLTGAMHAAAFFTPDGAVVAVREDAGRHNALDKLVGALARDHRTGEAGFAVLTSRCSYELVEKAVIARIPLLVTISAPTTLAIARAREARLTLVSLARSDSALIFSDPFGLF
jgi:FdhD protein